MLQHNGMQLLIDLMEWRQHAGRANLGVYFDSQFDVMLIELYEAEIDRWIFEIPSSTLS